MTLVMRRLVVTALVPSFLVACQGRPAESATVTDSAGIRISITRDSETVFATVDTVPAVSVGGSGQRGPTQLFQLRGVVVDRDGRIWVADGQSGELRIFHADGSHWKTRGGRGDGPGEFQRIRLLGSFVGDSVAVSDDASGRLSVFDPEGELARTARISMPDRPVPRTHDVFDDGAVLGQVPRRLRASSLEPGQVLADTARIVRLSPGDRAVVPLAEVGGPLWLWTGSNQIAIPFTANPGLEVIDDALHLVEGPEFRVRVFEKGGLAEIYGVAREPRGVTHEDLDSYRTTMEEHLPERLLPDYLSVLDHPARPEVLPAYQRLILSTDRNVWVQRFAPDHVWDVYGPDREWRGFVEVPVGFIPEHATDSTLVGIWRDELQVEHLRVYRFRPE